MNLRTIVTAFLCSFFLNLTAQEVVVEYPYNPDFENDGNVGVEDLMQLLASFGMGFDVDEINIDEVALSEWLQAISETLVAQQALIDSLMSNEANSGIGQLDSALIADMINEAGSATASFGERVHLGEPADWGSLPWDEYVNYGTYDFDDAGIFMGFFKYPFYDIYLLHDTIDVQELSASQLQDHYSVAQTSNGTESFSVPVGVDERIVVRGLPNSFGASDDYNFDWVPLLTSSLDAASEAESLGLVFGETVYSTSDNIAWYPEYPENPDNPSLVTHFDFDTDGLLRLAGPDCGSVKYAIIPDSVSSPLTGDILESNYSQTFMEMAETFDATIPLPIDLQVVFVSENGNCFYDFAVQWTPIESSIPSNNEQSITSQEVYFDSPQQYIHLEELTDHVLVGGNNFAENGCSGCAYSYHLVLPEGDIPDGFEILVWYSPNYGEAPDFQVISNSVPNELLNEEGPCVGKFVWFGNRWFRI